MSTVKILLLMELLMAAMMVVTSVPVASTQTEIENFCKKDMNQSDSVTQECMYKPNTYTLTREGDKAVISYLCCLGYFCIGRTGIREDVHVYLGYASPSVQRHLMRISSQTEMKKVAKTLRCQREQNMKKNTDINDCILLMAPSMFPSVQKATVDDLVSEVSFHTCDD